MPKVLDELLEHVVRREVLNAKDQYGWAPLHILAQNAAHATDKCNMLSMLIEAEADPNVRGNRGATPLFKAAATSATSQLHVLLSLGVDPNEATDEGVTALDACWHNRACKAILQEAGGRQGDGVTSKGRISSGAKKGFPEDAGGLPSAQSGGPEPPTRPRRSGGQGGRGDKPEPSGLGGRGVGAKPDALAVPEGSARARGAASRTSSRARAAATAGPTGRARRRTRGRASAAARARATTRTPGHTGLGAWAEPTRRLPARKGCRRKAWPAHSRRPLGGA